MSGGGDRSNDGLWMIFLIFMLFFGFLFAIWYFFTPYVLQGYLWLRQGEVMIGSLWTDDDMVVNAAGGSMSFGMAKNIVMNVTPEMLLSDAYDHWKIIAATSKVILTPLKIPFGILFGIMALLALFRSPTSKYRRTYGMNDLINVQSETFRVISPIKEFNPLHDVPPRAPGSLVPAELPLFAEALSPEEWVAFNKIPVPDGELDRDAAEKAFTSQLLGAWQGYKKLPPYLQVLLACFAMKASRKRQEADEMLGELATCWSHKSGMSVSGSLVSRARKILKNPDISASTIKECNRHAFITTALIGALDNARSEGGVLAPAQFLWLRGENRALWYPLNNLGRQAFHAEALGAMAHYRAEKQVGRPIPKPMVKDAVDVLSEFINNKEKSMPIPQLDFSMIKNKKAPTKNKGVMKPMGT